MFEKLTDEQIKKLKKYVADYTKIGLSCEPINKQNARAFANNLYTKILSRKKPQLIIMPSPRSAWIATCLLANGDQVREQVGAQVRDQVGEQVRDQVRDQIRAQVGDQVGDQVRAQVRDQVWTQVEEQVNNFVWPYLEGQFDANIFAYYDYFIKECKIKIDKKLLNKYLIWKESINFGIIYPLEKCCIISERPTVIKKNRNGLHCETGPAVQYPDGFSIYKLNGVTVPEWVVNTPFDKIPVNKVLEEKNVEVRRELIRKIGIEKLVKESGAKLLDKSKDEVYELLLINLGNGLEWPYLKMKNPSIGCYHLEAVGKECKTVEEANKLRRSRLPNPNIKPNVLT